MRASWKKEIEEAKEVMKQRWENVTLKQLAIFIAMLFYIIAASIFVVYMLREFKEGESKRSFPTKADIVAEQKKDCW